MRYLIIILLTATFAGCAPSPLSDDWLTPRPLGGDMTAYRPPPIGAEPPATPGGYTADAAAFSKELALRDALTLALLRNPQLAAFGYEARAAEARTLQAGLSPNPEAGIMVEDFGGTGGNRSFEGAETTLSISQLVELGGKREKRVRFAEADRQRAGWDYEAERLNVITTTAQRFIEVLAAQERVALAKQTAELTGQTHRTVEDRVKSGLVPAADGQRALVRLSTERIALSKAERQLDTARQKLAAMWAGSTPMFTTAAGALADLPPLPAAQDLVAHVNNNPQVARWTVEMAQRKAALDLAKSKAVPDVTGSVGVRRMHEADDTVYLFEIMVPLPFSDRNQGGILEARYNLAKGDSERKAAEIAVRTALTEAYNDLAAAHHEAVTLRDEAMPAAKSAFDSSQKAYESGLSSLLEVFDAQRTLIDVQREQIEAQARYRAAAATVEGLIGRPLQKPQARG